MTNQVNFDTFKKNGFTNEQILSFQSSYNQDKLENIEMERHWISLVYDMLQILDKENSTTSITIENHLNTQH